MMCYGGSLCRSIDDEMGIWEVIIKGYLAKVSVPRDKDEAEEILMSSFGKCSRHIYVFASADLSSRQLWLTPNRSGHNVEL